MTVIAANDFGNYAQPQLPPPQTHTVTGNETVAQLAQQYGVAPEELARGNNISVDSALSPGQVLTLPAHAVANATQAAPATQTPAQKTDAAIAAYQGALKQRDDDMRSAPRNAGLRADLDSTEQDRIDTAKKAMDQAIADEVAGEVAFRNQGTPIAFRTPTDQLIDNAGSAIVARHPGDATLAATIQGAVGTYKFQNQVNGLIPEYSDGTSPADKLKGIMLHGQPPEVVAAVAADPRVQAWAKEAAGQVDQAYANGKNGSGSLDAAHALLASIQGLPPPLAAEVVRQSMPTIQKMGQVSMNGPGQQTFGSMQRVISALGEGPDAQDLANQVAGAYLHQAEDWSQQTLNSVTAAMNGGVRPTLAMALAHALQNDGKAEQAQDITAAATIGQQSYLANAQDSPLKAYNDAHQAKLDKDQRLAQLLAHAGPLNNTQKAAFIKAYRKDPDNAKVYDADTAAAGVLASYMSAHQNELLAAAARSPDNAKQLYECMKDVNQSGQGKTALAFVVAIKADAGAAQAFNAFSDYQSDFVDKAVAAAQAQLLVEGNGDDASAATQLLNLAAPLFQGQEGWSSMVSNYQRLANGEEDVHTAEELGKELRALGPGGKGLAMGSIMVNALNGGLGDNISGIINSFGTAAGNGAGLASGALESLVDADKLGGTAAGFAKFSARLIPGLSVIASTASFASDFKSMQSDPVYAGAVVGDLFSVIGSALEATGIGEVPGAFINGIGSLVAAPFQFIGGLIDDHNDAEQLHKDVVKYLGQSGLSAADVKLMAGSDPDQVKQWLATGISPEHLQELAHIDPDLLQSDGSSGPDIGWLQSAGVGGEDIYNMLKQVQADGGSVTEVMHVLGRPDWYNLQAVQSKTELAQDLLATAQQKRMSIGAALVPLSAQGEKSLTDAANWLQAQKTA